MSFPLVTESRGFKTVRRKKRINTSFVRVGVTPIDMTPAVQYTSFETTGTRIAAAFLDAFRYRRTSFVGAPLPGKEMLVPPPLTCYRQSSSL